MKVDNSKILGVRLMKLCGFGQSRLKMRLTQDNQLRLNLNKAIQLH